MVKFKDNDLLGKRVKSVLPFCSIGVKPVTELNQLRFAAGGHKFSELCGFIFETARENIEFKKFLIAFVCKLRSKIYRQKNYRQKIYGQQMPNPSQWFIFRRISKTQIDVLDKNALLVNYGFDINEFFKSDLFLETLPKFKQSIENGLKDCTAMVSNLKENDKQLGMLYIKAIQDSLEYMPEHKVNNSYFVLRDLDAIQAKLEDALKKQIAAKKDADLDASIDKKVDAMKKANVKTIAKMADYSEFRKKGDYIYLKLHGKSAKKEAEDVSESSQWKCIVKKEKENGKDVWKVYEEKDHVWVATCATEVSALQFAAEYPVLKQKYLDQDTLENPTVDEKSCEECSELDKRIEEALEQIYK